MSKKASDISAEVARMTRSVMQVPAAPQPVRPAGTPPSARATGKPRFTVIMDREQHRYIKQLALDIGSDASTITRSLFTLLQNDPALARRLRHQLAEDGGISW